MSWLELRRRCPEFARSDAKADAATPHSTEPSQGGVAAAALSLWRRCGAEPDTFNESRNC